MSFKVYILIGIAVGLLVFLIGYLAGDEITKWAVKQQGEANARGMPAVAEIVFRPVEFIFDQNNRPWGAIVAGVAWPAVAVWTVFVIIGLLIIVGVDATSGVDGEIPGNMRP